MSNPNAFLSTLAESAAAIVAIVGGLLVSRLVAISSEREGLRRQLGHARDQLRQVSDSYIDAHQYRLANSKSDFTGFVLDDLVVVPPDEVDRDAILEEHIPRGSSREEMEPHLDDLITAVTDAASEVAQYLQPDDDRSIELEDLEERGLRVTDDQRRIYRKVVNWMAERLPQRSSLYGGAMPYARMPDIVNPAWQTTELRRLDESIQQEQALDTSRRALALQIERLDSEMALVGHPVGVTPAILVLSLYSVFGIVVPVVVMGLSPKTLSGLTVWLLVVLFTIGLVGVIGYILWYARKLSAHISDDRSTGTTP